MTPKEFEPAIALYIPQISLKTSHEKLKEFSTQRWVHNGRRRVAADVIANGKELLAGSNIDWELVLGSIRIEQVGSVQFGEAAIAAYDAFVIGGLSVASGCWSMHDPAIVYLSAKCLANRVSGELEDFKSRMRQVADAYGQKALPQADLYMKTLDFLLEFRDRNRHKNIIKQVVSLLGEGKIEEAYKIASSRDDLVRRRG